MDHFTDLFLLFAYLKLIVFAFLSYGRGNCKMAGRCAQMHRQILILLLCNIFWLVLSKKKISIYYLSAKMVELIKLASSFS